MLRHHGERKAERVRVYHEKQRASSWDYTDADGTRLGQKVTPLDRVGPLRVARESRALTAALATSGLAVILLLALALVFAALRLGQLRRRLRDLERPR